MNKEEFEKLTSSEQNEFVKKITKEAEEELSKLTPEEISDKFDEMIEKFDLSNNNPVDSYPIENEIRRYHLYWKARSMNDPNGTWSEKDQIKFPRYGHAEGSWIEPIGRVGKALNSIEGVHSSIGTIYVHECVHNGRMIWFITFDSIKDYQHFLWAGCFRYFPLAKNPDWLLTVDDGDPDYNETDKIRMQLQYQDVNAEREKWERDLNEFADGLLKYSENLHNIEENMTKNKE